jgi:predicted NBD/HSP70 family sugar kinase
MPGSAKRSTPTRAAEREAPGRAQTRPLRQGSLREANLSAILSAVCRSADPVSRAELAGDLGVTRATASRLVDELVAGGLLDELDPAAPSGRGRPARPLAPGAAIVALGVELDLAGIVARAVSLRGEVVAESRVAGDFVASDARAVLPVVAETIAHVLGQVTHRRVLGVCVAVPGVVDRNGLLRRAANLGWNDTDVSGELGLLLGEKVRVHIANEAHLAARAAAEISPGRPGPWSDFIYVSGHLGVGGAVVRSGRVEAGASELGHVTVDPAGPRCGCGSTGCLEQYAGLSATADPDDQELAQVSRSLAVALAGVVNVVGITTVVLGGRLAGLHGRLEAGLTASLTERVLASPWDTPVVHADPRGQSGAALGAAFLLLEAAIADPAHVLSVH